MHFKEEIILNSIKDGIPVVIQEEAEEIIPPKE